jgi:hypothetical protein
MLLGLLHGANQTVFGDDGGYLEIGYMVITTSSNTLGNQTPCIAQVTVVHLSFANHHIIISQRHALPALDLKTIVGESTAQSLRTIIIQRIIITIIIAYVRAWV